MTGEHDYNITVQPFVCRHCERTLDEARATDQQRLCAAGGFDVPDVYKQRMLDKVPMAPGPRGTMTPDPITDAIVDENGTYRPRHAADDYQGIAERLRDLGYQKWITE